MDPSQPVPSKFQPCSIATPDPHTQGTEMDPSLQPVPSKSRPCSIATPDPHTQGTETDPSSQPVPSNSQQVQCSTAVQDTHTSGTEMDCTKHPAGLLGNNGIQLAPKQRSPELHNPCAMISMCNLSNDSGQPVVMESPQGEAQITHPVWLPSDTHKSNVQDTQNEHPDARTLLQKHQERDVYLAGMSCRIPGGDNLEELRQLLASGKPEEGGTASARWPESLFEVPVPIRCLNADSHFDADFWQMNDTEASSCTPLLRFLLEVIYECVLDSGLTLTDMQSSQNKTGIYLAVSSEMDGFVTSQHCRTPFTVTSSMMPVVIGGMLRTKGPAICVDANANSSLVAVHSAVMDLQRGVVHYAIVAGGNLLLNPYAALGVEWEKLQSHRKFVQSDGVAAVLLVKDEGLCRKIYSRVLGVGLSYSTEKDPENLDDLGAELLSQAGVDRLVKVVKEDPGQSEHLGHCGPAEGLVRIIRGVLGMPTHPSSSVQLPDELLGAVLVQNQGMGGELGCVLLKPYLSNNQDQSLASMVLLPLQLRQPAGLEQVCKAITGPQCSARMIQLMGQSLLVTDDEQPGRAYVVVSPGKEIVATGIESFEWTPRSFALFFGDFFTINFSVDKGLYNIPAFAESMRRSDKVLSQILEDNQDFVDIFKTDTYSFIYLGTVVQIALADVLKACLRDNLAAMGAGLGTLAAAYYDGCLTHTQCLHVTCCMVRTLSTWSQAQGKDYATLLVKLPRDQVYTLGPRVTVLAVYTSSLSLIGVHATPSPFHQEQHSTQNTSVHSSDVPHEHPSPVNVSVHLASDTVHNQQRLLAGGDHSLKQRSSLNAPHHRKAPGSLDASCHMEPKRMDVQTCLDWVTEMIGRKGGVAWKVPATPFYNPQLRPSASDLLLHQMRSILCKPRMWSETSMSVSHSGTASSLVDVQCTAESLLGELLHPVDHQAPLRRALQDPSLVVVAHLPSCHAADVEGLDLGGDQLSRRLMGLKATPFELATLLGELHLLGCRVDAGELSERPCQGPADCTVPSLSPLVSWDHSREWPLPHWTQFTYREKDKVQSLYKFEVEYKETESASPLGDILYHTWYAIDSRLQGKDRVGSSAVRLCNMTLHCSLLSIWNISPLFVHAHMGRQVFHVYTDKLVVSGNFDSAGDMDMPLFRASWLGWNSMAWLPFFRMLMGQIQGTLEGECLQQNQEFFPHEVIILPRRHLAMMEECGLELVVEKYTGVCSVGGVTLKFLPCPDTAPTDDLAKCHAASSAAAPQETADTSPEKAWSQHVSSLVTMGTDMLEPTPECVSRGLESEAGDSSSCEQRRDSDAALSLPEDTVRSDHGGVEQKTEVCCQYTEMMVTENPSPERARVEPEVAGTADTQALSSETTVQDKKQHPSEEQREAVGIGQADGVENDSEDEAVRMFGEHMDFFSKNSSRFRNLCAEAIGTLERCLASFSPAWCHLEDAGPAEEELKEGLSALMTAHFHLLQGEHLYLKAMRSGPGSAAQILACLEHEKDATRWIHPRKQAFSLAPLDMFHMYRLNEELCKATRAYLIMARQVLQEFLEVAVVFQDVDLQGWSQQGAVSAHGSTTQKVVDSRVGAVSAHSSMNQKVVDSGVGSWNQGMAAAVQDSTDLKLAGSEQGSSSQKMIESAAGLPDQKMMDTLNQWNPRIVELRKRLIVAYINVCQQCLLTQEIYEESMDLSFEERLMRVEEHNTRDFMLMSRMMNRTLLCHLDLGEFIELGHLDQGEFGDEQGHLDLGEFDDEPGHQTNPSPALKRIGDRASADMAGYCRAVSEFRAYSDEAVHLYSSMLAGQKNEGIDLWIAKQHYRMKLDTIPQLLPCLSKAGRRQHRLQNRIRLLMLVEGGLFPADPPRAIAGRVTGYFGGISIAAPADLMEGKGAEELWDDGKLEYDAEHVDIYRQADDGQADQDFIETGQTSTQEIGPPTPYEPLQITLSANLDRKVVVKTSGMPADREALPPRTSQLPQSRKEQDLLMKEQATQSAGLHTLKHFPLFKQFTERREQSKQATEQKLRDLTQTSQLPDDKRERSLQMREQITRNTGKSMWKQSLFFKLSTERREQSKQASEQRMEEMTELSSQRREWFAQKLEQLTHKQLSTERTEPPTQRGETFPLKSQQPREREEPLTQGEETLILTGPLSAQTTSWVGEDESTDDSIAEITGTDYTMETDDSEFQEFDSFVSFTKPEPLVSDARPPPQPRDVSAAESSEKKKAGAGQLSDSSDYTDRHPSDSAARTSPWNLGLPVPGAETQGPASSPISVETNPVFSVVAGQLRTSTPLLHYLGSTYRERCPSDSETQGARYFETMKTHMAESPAVCEVFRKRMARSFSKPANLHRSYLGLDVSSKCQEGGKNEDDFFRDSGQRSEEKESVFDYDSWADPSAGRCRKRGQKTATSTLETSSLELQSSPESTAWGRNPSKPQAWSQRPDAVKNKDHFTEPRAEAKEPVFRNDPADSPTWERRRQQWRSESSAFQHHSWPGSTRRVKKPYETSAWFSPVEYSLFEPSLSPECHSVTAWRDWNYREPHSYGNTLRDSHAFGTAAAVTCSPPRRGRVCAPRGVGFARRAGSCRTESKPSPAERSHVESCSPVDSVGDTDGQRKWSSPLFAAKKFPLYKHDKESLTTQAAKFSGHRGILPRDKLHNACHRCRSKSEPHQKPGNLNTGDMPLDRATRIEKINCPSLKETSFNAGFVKKNCKSGWTTKAELRSKELSLRYQDADVSTAVEKEECWGLKGSCLSAGVVKEKDSNEKKTTKPQPVPDKLSTEGKGADVTASAERKECPGSEESPSSEYLVKERLDASKKNAKLGGTKTVPKHSFDPTDRTQAVDSDGWMQEVDKLMSRKGLEMHLSEKKMALLDGDPAGKAAIKPELMPKPSPHLDSHTTFQKIDTVHFNPMKTSVWKGICSGDIRDHVDDELIGKSPVTAESSDDHNIASTQLEPYRSFGGDQSEPDTFFMLQVHNYVAGIVQMAQVQLSVEMMDAWSPTASLPRLDWELASDETRTFRSSTPEKGSGWVAFQSGEGGDTFDRVESTMSISLTESADQNDGIDQSLGISDVPPSQLRDSLSTTEDQKRREKKTTQKDRIRDDGETKDNVSARKRMVFAESSDGHVDCKSSHQSKPSDSLNRQNTDGEDDAGRKGGVDPVADVGQVRDYVAHVIQTAQIQFMTLTDTHANRSSQLSGLGRECAFEEIEVFRNTPKKGAGMEDGEGSSGTNSDDEGDPVSVDPTSAAPFDGGNVTKEMRTFSLAGSPGSLAASSPAPGLELLECRDRDEVDLGGTAGQAEITDQMIFEMDGQPQADPSAQKGDQEIPFEMDGLPHTGIGTKIGPQETHFEMDSQPHADSSTRKGDQEVLFETDGLPHADLSTEKGGHEMIFEMDDLPHTDGGSAAEVPQPPPLGTVPSLQPTFVYSQPPRLGPLPPLQPLPTFLKWGLTSLTTQSLKGKGSQQADFVTQLPFVEVPSSEASSAEAPSMSSAAQRNMSPPVSVPDKSSSAPESEPYCIGSAVQRDAGSTEPVPVLERTSSASTPEQRPMKSAARRSSSSPIPIPGQCCSSSNPESPSRRSASQGVHGSSLPNMLPYFPLLGTSPSSVAPISLMCRASLFQDDVNRMGCITSPRIHRPPISVEESTRLESDKNSPIESASSSRQQELGDGDDSNIAFVDNDNNNIQELDNSKDSSHSESDEETDASGQGLGSIEQMRAGHDLEQSFYDISVPSVDCSDLTRMESCSDWDSPKAFGESHTPRKSSPRRRDVSLEALSQGLTQREVWTVASPPMATELLTEVPPHIDQQLLTVASLPMATELLTVDPPQMNKELLTEVPPQMNKELLTEVPPHIDRQLLTVASPRIDQTFVTVAPSCIEQELLTIAPPQIDQELLTIAPPQIDQELLTIAPPQIDQELLTVLPPQLDTKLLTVPSPVDSSVPYSMMCTPVMDAGSDVSLIVPATPVPHMKRSRVTSVSAGVGSQSSSLWRSFTASTPALTKTRCRRTPVAELSVGKSVTSLSSPFVDLTTLNAGFKESPLFENPRVPASPSAAGEEPASRDALEARDLPPPKNLAAALYSTPSKTAKQQTAEKEGMEFQQTVIPWNEMVFIRSQGLSSTASEAGDPGDFAVLGALSGSQDSVSIDRAKQKLFASPPRLSEAKGEVSSEWLEARAERVVISEEKSCSVDNVLLRGAGLEITGSPDLQEKKCLASKEPQVKWDIAWKGARGMETEGSVNLKTTEEAVDQETEVSVDWLETEVSVDWLETEVSADGLETAVSVDQKETAVAVGQETGQAGDQKEMKVAVDQKEIKVAVDQKEIKVAVDQKEIKVAVDQKEMKVAVDQKEIKVAVDQKEIKVAVDQKETKVAVNQNESKVSGDQKGTRVSDDQMVAKVSDDQDSKVCEDQKSKVSDDQDSKVCEDQKSKVSDDQDSKVCEDQKSKVSDDQDSKVCEDQKSKVSDDQEFKANDDQETKVNDDQETKVNDDLRETELADNQETAVAIDLKELPHHIFKKPRTHAFIFNASDHLKKLIKSRVTSMRDGVRPDTPLTPTKDRARPVTPLAPTEDKANPTTPLTPAKDRARPASPLTPTKDRARPASPLTPTEDRARPATPLTPTKDRTRPDTPLTPTEDRARPASPLTPTEDRARPASPLASCPDRARLCVKTSPVKQSTSEGEDIDDNTAQICKMEKMSEAVVSFQAGAPQVDLARRWDVRSSESAAHRARPAEDETEKTTLTEAKAFDTFSQMRKVGVMVATFEAEEAADGASAKDSAPLPPQIFAPWKRGPQISVVDLAMASQTGATPQSATLAAERSEKADTQVKAEQSEMLDVQEGRCQANQPTRKVSVVNTTGRKLTPSCPGVQGLLAPTVLQSVLERLAPLKGKSATARPLYIVHPITGTVEILRELAVGLDVRCIGIKKTDHTPDFSVETLARFYCQAILQEDSFGSYWLAGYSYGGMVVFEMARQIQREGKKVALLLMLDGSPDYVKSQTQFPQRSLPPDISPEHRKAVIETHFLLHFMGMYGPVQQRALVQTMLEEQKSQEDRVEAAIGITMGTVQISSSVARGRWLGLKSKMEMKQGRRPKVSIGHVADNIISLKRQQKAIKFLQAAHIADQYDATEGELFQGDIHLVRIRSFPEYSCSLPADYRLSRLCTGTVQIHYVDGSHESMMQSPQVEAVIAAVQTALKASHC